MTLSTTSGGGKGTRSGRGRGRKLTKIYDPTQLAPLTGKARKRRFIGWDIETKDGPTQAIGMTRPFLCGLYDGESYEGFFDFERLDSQPDWWRKKGRGGKLARWQNHWYLPGGCVDRFMRAALTKKYANAWFYAHNGGNFDFLFLLPWLALFAESMGLSTRFIPAGTSGLLAVDVFDKHKRWRKWRFVDSLKLLPMSLAKAAVAFNVGEKYARMGGGVIYDAQGREFDMRNDPDERDIGWLDYNESDCRLLYGVLEKAHDLLENELGGEIGLTAPSTSMRTYRRRFLEFPVDRDLDTHAFIRESYVGGRVEKLESYGEHLSYYDINSSYPASMTDTVPAGGAVWCTGEPPLDYMRSRIGFVRALVRVPEDCVLCPLPIRADERHFPQHAGVGGKLVFPAGILTGVWEWGELRHAIESCDVEVLEWKESVWYHARPLLRDFVEVLYRYRDKAQCFRCHGALGQDASDPYWCSSCKAPGYDDALAELAKLLMNSLYGRFAMRPDRVKLWWHTDPEIPEGAKPLIEGDVFCQIWVTEDEGDDTTILPQISARITALSRVRLHKYALDIMSRINRACTSCHSKATFIQPGVDHRCKVPLLTASAQFVGGFGPHGHGEGKSTIGPLDKCCPCGGALVTTKGRVLYTDTDSLVADTFMESATELGALKDEVPRYSGFLRGNFYAPKLYRLSVTESYSELPESERLRMLQLDTKAVAKLKSDGDWERALGGKFSEIKGKGLSQKLRTEENLEILYQGALTRLEWIAKNTDAFGNRPPMTVEVEQAGTVYDRRLEKFAALASLVQRNPDGSKKLYKDQDGREHAMSDSFGRGPKMVVVPKRLHLSGAKRREFPDGATAPYVIDMTAEPAQWWHKQQARREKLAQKRAERAKKEVSRASQ